MSKIFSSGKPIVVEGTSTNISQEMIELAVNKAVLMSSLEALDDLSDLGEFISDKAEKGEGLDQDATAVLEQHIASVKRRVGIEMRSGFVSRENFKNGTSAQEVKALEGVISNTFAKVWDAVTSLFRKIVDRIQDIFSSYEEVFVKYNNRLLAVKESIANGALDKTIDETVLSISSSVKRNLTSDGRTVVPGEIIKLLGQSRKIVDVSGSAAKSLIDAVGGFSKKCIDGDFDNLKEEFEKISKIETSLLSTLRKSDVTTRSAFADSETFGPIFGYMFVVVGIETFHDYFNDQTYRYPVTDTFRGYTEVKDIPVPTKKEALQLVNEGLLFSKTVIDTFSGKGYLRASLGGLTVSLNRLISQSNRLFDFSDESRKVRTNARHAKNFAVSITHITTLMYSEIPHSQWAAFRSLSEYLEKTIRVYK